MKVDIAKNAQEVQKCIDDFKNYRLWYRSRTKGRWFISVSHPTVESLLSMPVSRLASRPYKAVRRDNPVTMYAVYNTITNVPWCVFANKEEAERHALRLKDGVRAVVEMKGLIKADIDFTTGEEH